MGPRTRSSHSTSMTMSHSTSLLFVVVARHIATSTSSSLHRTGMAMATMPPSPYPTSSSFPTSIDSSIVIFDSTSFSFSSSSSPSSAIIPESSTTPDIEMHSTSTIYSSSRSSSGFLFDVRAKKRVQSSSSSSSSSMETSSMATSPLMIYGLELDLYDASSASSFLDAVVGGGDGNDGGMRMEVYTRLGNHRGHEYDIDGWTLWMNLTNVRGNGLDLPTYLPQWHDGVDHDGVDVDWEEASRIEHISLMPGETRSFYVRTMDGPHLRYTEYVDAMADDDEDVNASSAATTPSYYHDEYLAIMSSGTAKRSGWDGYTFAPRVLCGGVHYYLGNVPDGGDASDGNDDDDLLDDGNDDGDAIESPNDDWLLFPGVGWTSRSASPTRSPSMSMMPSISLLPTIGPTEQPTISPTDGPTVRPSLSPLVYGYLSTEFVETNADDDDDGGGGGGALIYAGSMFDIKARMDVEVSSFGFHTYWTSYMDVEIYFRHGGYGGYDDDVSIGDWIYACNVTVMGMGIGNPTYVPYGSFEPVLLRKRQVLGVYVSTNGPYLLSTRGEMEGKPHVANPYLVLYEGNGKRRPLGSGTYSPRIFNGVIGYNPVVVPTNMPTIDVADLWVANITLEPVADTYVERDNDSEIFGESAQLKVDGSPERVALMQFDLSSLLGDTPNRPDQVLGARLRLYSMTSMSMYGGRVSVIPDGYIDEGSTVWDDCDYAMGDTGIYVGSFRAVWPEKFYEIDLTSALRSSILPTSIVVRIGSEGGEKAVMYRSRDGGGPNVPSLTISFAYDPNTNVGLARAFGSDPPTFAPTILPVWENAPLPPWDAITSTYFNYDPSASYGPEYWENVEQDGYYDQLRRLDTDTSNNRCSSGDKQSPRDLCDTNDECIEFHMPRPRVGMYGLRDESLYRPTPMIMHNKLRLSYPERRSEGELPEPPGTDFANNVFNSGVQDLVNIDIKVKSEHRLCGKQYDGEMQLVHVHGQEGNLEILSILIEAGGNVEGEMGYEDNPHFQLLLDYFQRKYDQDAGLCQRRRRRARALLFDAGRGGRVRRRREGEDGNERSGTIPHSGPSSSAIDEDASDREEGMVDGMDDVPSLADYLYRTIHEKFESLISGRRLARLDRWNPLEPWYVYKSVHFWGYQGSITEPPCFQGVNWRVLDVPMIISMRQLVQLKTLMFDHVDPDTCQKTSTHFEESNARPVQPWTEGSVYRCRRSDYASDMERAASGRRKGFVQEEKWWGVDNYPYVTPEFPDAG